MVVYVILRVVERYQKAWEGIREERRVVKGDAAGWEGEGEVQGEERVGSRGVREGIGGG